MSPPSAARRPSRRRCRKRQPAISRPAAAQTGRPRRTDRRCACARLQCSVTSARQRFLAGHRRLQERAGRQRDLCRADRDHRRRCASAPARHGASAAPADAVRRSRESLAIIAVDSGPEPRTSTSRPLSVAVIWMSSGLPVDISGSAIAHAASMRAVQIRVEDRAAVDRNDVVRACRREADLEHVMRSHPGVQGDAPPARAMGIDQRRHVAMDSACASVVDHEIALPGTIALGVPVLDRAAAADAEMRAERRRSVPGWRARPAAGAGGRDGGLEPARPRPFRRQACTAHRRFPPRQWRRRRRDGRRDR